MGCICSKNNEKSSMSYIKKLETYKIGFKHKSICNCFKCFKAKGKNEIDIKEIENKNNDGIDLVRVAVPSVVINDIQTPIEKLKKSFSGVYMRDKGLNTFVNSSYIDNKPKSPESKSDIDNNSDSI